MSRNKLKKYQQLDTFANVFQEKRHYEGDNYHSNQNHKLTKYQNNFQYHNFQKFLDHNKNKNRPLILELACGKGAYVLALAKKYPKKDIIGVDIKGDRIWDGAKKAQQLKLSNAFFLRIDIRAITDYLPKQSVSNIWLTFPGPFPKARHEKHRLTNDNFLKKYHQILEKNGHINFKTDSQNLAEYTQEVLSKHPLFRITLCSHDIYQEKESLLRANLDSGENVFIKTDYERAFLKKNKTIKYFEITPKQNHKKT
jgi:tRNA (guanine-N7-)-methyltransferase